MLRKLLAAEADVLDRHFMYAHLESALYRCRDAFTSALDEYDEACRTPRNREAPASLPSCAAVAISPMSP